MLLRVGSLAISGRIEKCSWRISSDSYEGSFAGIAVHDYDGLIALG